jgi:hypothetical protein
MDTSANSSSGQEPGRRDELEAYRETIEGAVSPHLASAGRIEAMLADMPRGPGRDRLVALTKRWVRELHGWARLSPEAAVAKARGRQARQQRAASLARRACRTSRSHQPTQVPRRSRPRSRGSRRARMTRSRRTSRGPDDGPGEPAGRTAQRAACRPGGAR